MRTLRDELDLRRKTEIHEIEERKNGQINSLMKNHEKAFSDIKNYYNDITLNNLALINTLKVSVFIICTIFIIFVNWKHSCCVVFHIYKNTARSTCDSTVHIVINGFLFLFTGTYISVPYT